METLEEKIDKLTSNIEKLSVGVEQIGKDLNGFIEHTNERSTKIEDSIEAAKREILETISKNKLDTLDKYATNERVDKQEIRIQKLETNIA